MDRSDLPSEEEQCEVEVPAGHPPAIFWRQRFLPGHYRRDTRS